MRIGFIFAGDFEEGNGANSRIKAHAKGLTQLGENVELLILHASSFNNSGINKKKSGYWQEIPFRFLNGRYQRPNGQVRKLIDNVRALWLSLRYLWRNARSYDVIYYYCPQPFEGLPIYLMLKLLGIPLVIEMTERVSSKYDKLYPSFNERILQKINLWHERKLGQLCNHIVVISQRLYNYYTAWVPSDRLSLVPIVVDFERFEHLNSNSYQSMRIGYVGSFGEKDGVLGIIQAFHQAKVIFPKLRIRLIGYADEEARESVKNANFEENGVEFFGQVFYSNIPNYLHSCDLLIVNRPNTPYAHYGFPTKLGEYLATGQPVIATEVGDVTRYLADQQNVILVPPDSPEQLTKAICRRYEYYDYYTRLGRNGANAGFYHFDYRYHSQTLCKILYQTAGKQVPASLTHKGSMGINDWVIDTNSELEASDDSSTFEP